MELSVIIPTHRRPDGLKRLLASLCHQRFDDDRLEVIVVSNLADERVRQTVEEMKDPRVIYAESGDVGVNLARNRGLALARGEIVYFLDDDCELLSSDHLQRLISTHRRFPTVTAVGGGYQHTSMQNGAALAYGAIAESWVGSADGEAPSWRLVGGNTSYKRNRLNEAGASFDASIIFGGSETELHARLESIGHEGLLSADLKVAHHSRLGTFDLLRKAFSQGMGARLVADRYPASRSRESCATQEDRSVTGTSLHSSIYDLMFDVGFSRRVRGRVGQVSNAALVLYFFGGLMSLLGCHARTLSVRAFWLGHAFVSKTRGLLWVSGVQAYWRVHHIFCLLKSFSRHVLRTLYWRVYHWVCVARGFCVRLYWLCHHGVLVSNGLVRHFATVSYWKGHRALSITRSYLPHLATVSYWRLYHWRCVARGAIVRLSVQTYWLAVRALKFVYWSTYKAFSDSYWKAHRLAHRHLGNSKNGMLRSIWSISRHVVGATQAVRFLAAMGLHRRPWCGSGSVIFEGLRMLTESRELKGSRTSLLFHRLFRSRYTDCSSAVYLGEGTQDEILIRAAKAQSFGFSKVIVDHAHASFFADINKLGLEVLSFCDPADDAFAIDDPVTVPLIARNSIIDFRRSPGFIAIAADALQADVENAAKWSRQCGARLIMTDFASDASADAASLFEVARDLLSLTKFRDLKWQKLQVIRPYDCSHISADRFLKGDVVMDTGATNPKWSVIIPYYQTPEYIEEVCRHVYLQNYPLSDIEILIIDDGSPMALADEKQRELREIVPQGARLRIIRLDRGTADHNYDSSFRAGVARNAGIFHALGKHVLFIDSDIILAANHLTLLDAALDESEIVQIVREMLTPEASSKAIDLLKLRFMEQTYREDAYWEDFKSTDDWNLMSAPWKYVCSYALAFKRETLNSVRPFRPEFCEYGFEDTELGFRMFERGARFHLLKEPCFHLYPLTRSWQVHFNEEARQRALSKTARQFFGMHRDPSIYFELQSLLSQSNLR